MVSDAAAWLYGDALRVRVGCELSFESQIETPLLLLIRPTDSPLQAILDEARSIEPAAQCRQYRDAYGNYVWRIQAPAGRLTVKHDLLVAVPPTADPVLPDLGRTMVEDLPDEVIVFTLPSRHCQSDLLQAEAVRLFGDVPAGWAQVQAVCDYLHANIVYGAGSSPSTSAYEAFQAGRGVCRDFAHLGVTFCRALGYPARYVCGYLPDIGVTPDPAPMDFHAWFEVFLDGGWRTFDARHNVPRTGRVLIGRGRDAVDVAFATTYGTTRLVDMRVWADQVDLRVLPGDGPIGANAHEAYVS